MRLGKADFKQLRIDDHFNQNGLEKYLDSGDYLTRRVPLRNGKYSSSNIENSDDVVSDTDAEKYDLQWLKTKTKPPIEDSKKPLKVADLFCGCGGISLGVYEACRALNVPVEFVFAADIVPEYLEVYKLNFAPYIFESNPIESIINSPVGKPLSLEEKELKKKVGSISLLVGGPPCQGHSDLNNYTRRNDPKNKLFERMARFAEITKPEHIIIENVLGVRHDKYGVFHKTINALERVGYNVDTALIKAEKIGVPQRRHRAFIIASTSENFKKGFVELQLNNHVVKERSIKWAVNDLLNADGKSPIDMTTELSGESKKRVDWLFDNNEYDLPDKFRPDCHRNKNHTYKSVYGRLYWNQPAWTITTGFTVMGQGRFLHPKKRRVITPHEAARLQFFPDFFQFGSKTRKEYAKMIGNAVPPKMAYIIVLELLR